MTKIAPAGELNFTHISQITAYPGYEQQNANAPHTAVDQGCFLTGISDVALELVHIINAVRNKAAVGRKKDVVDFITLWLGIAEARGFHLEHMSNLVYLLPDIHRHIDTYSTIAITCSEHELVKLIDRFIKANAKWQEEVWLKSKRNSPYTRTHVNEIRREAIIIQDPNMSYDVVVLKAAHFLPFNRPLLFRDAPTTPIQQDQPFPPIESYSSWVMHQGELRPYDGSGGTRPPFVHATARRSPYIVNPLFWVLHATWKFREFKRRYPHWAQYVTSRGQRLMQLTEELGAQIYFKPTYHPDSSSAMDPIKLHELNQHQKVSHADQPVSEEVLDVDRESESDSLSDDMGSDTSSFYCEDTEPHAHEELSAAETRQIVAKITNLENRQSRDDVMDMAALLLFGHFFFIAAIFETPTAPGLSA
ncbi:hypothetical protein C8T65DRAFT_739656 [Cerioporus squamosus]|nr:hypothetical protein C8T65DRAFT_739656 [Cerioporus squamosus]